MRVAVVTSDYLTGAKRAIVDGLAHKLVGIASVPAMPKQVSPWRHIRSLVLFAGPRRLPFLLGGALVRRLPWVRDQLGTTRQPRTPAGLARSKCVPFLAVRTLDDECLRKWLDELSCDMVVSLQSHRVSEGLLQLPRLGWLNLHHGRLPDYRGVFSVFWAMANREPALYLTAHIMDAALDCGPVVVEEPIPVPEGASVASMEAEMWARSPEVMVRAVTRLEEGRAPCSRRTAKGHYYTYPTWSDLRRAAAHNLKLH